MSSTVLRSCLPLRASVVRLLPRTSYSAGLGLASRASIRHFHLQAAASSYNYREVISTEDAPAAAGPYSQAIKTSNLIFVSGQVGLIPGTKDLAAEDVEGQAEQVMKNLGAVLDASGSSFAGVVKTTVLLEDMGDFGAVNAIYSRYFPDQQPARACYAVKQLPLGAKVEIEAIALPN